MEYLIAWYRVFVEKLLTDAAVRELPGVYGAQTVHTGS